MNRHNISISESVLMLFANNYQNIVRACRNYSLPKLLAFLRHSVYKYINNVVVVVVVGPLCWRTPAIFVLTGAQRNIPIKRSRWDTPILDMVLDDALHYITWSNWHSQRNSNKKIRGRAKIRKKERKTRSSADAEKPARRDIIRGRGGKISATGWPPYRRNGRVVYGGSFNVSAGRSVVQRFQTENF